MSGTTRPRRAALAVAVALVGGAAVVGGTMLSSSGEPRPPQRPVAATSRLHALPPITDRLFTWTDTHERSAEAQRQVAIACMAERGFHYAPVAHKGTAGEDERPQLFGLESSLPPRAAPPVAEKPPKPGSPETTAAYGKALFGDKDKRVTAKGVQGMKVSRPGNGCLAEAETRILGDGRMRWLQVRIMLFEAQEQARADLEKDPAFKSATTRWQQCMKRHGFAGQRDPQQLLMSLRDDQARRGNPLLNADLSCKHDTGYLDTAYTRLAAVQQRWLDRNPAVTKDWTALLARQDKTSREVLGATSPG
ncbi:hypothetical protein AB0C77_04025 [Streptomyces sp. NPDC048629]|uniref:hypothetical protein n=1 Tax=Streptomyces sp. NPDC048629 TaxID=3154824 RepID=UPI00344663B7